MLTESRARIVVCSVSSRLMEVETVMSLLNELDLGMARATTVLTYHPVSYNNSEAAERTHQRCRTNLGKLVCVTPSLWVKLLSLRY